MSTNIFFAETILALPTKRRVQLKESLEKETGLDLKNRWQNWLQQKNSVPVHLRPTINRLAGIIISEVISEYVNDFEQQLIINLFPQDMDNNTHTQKTSIRIERAKHNMTQAELADKIGITVNTVNKIENQKGAVTLKTANLIAKFFGLNVSDFREFI